MLNTFLSKKIIVSTAILLGGLLITAGVLAFFGFKAFEPTVAAQSSEWTQETGLGISVPACASSSPPPSAIATCIGETPSVTFTWTVEGPDPDSVVCSTASITAGPSGGPQPTIATGQSCTGGSFDWSGATLFNTTYTYSINFENGGHIISNGSFQTPGYCTAPSPVPPPTVSCSVAPTSATTGENVTWTAVPSGGTAGAASGSINQSFGSGWSPTWMTSGQDQTISARRFQATSSYWLKKIVLNLAREAATTGRLRVTIENDAGGLPSGSAIIGGTSDLVNLSSVCVWTCTNWIDFTLPGVELTVGTNYWIVLRGYFDNTLAYSIIHNAGAPLDSNPGSKSLARGWTNPSVWSDIQIINGADLWYRTYAAISPPSYSYSWSGDPPLAGQTVNPVDISYPGPGPKTGSVNVTSDGQSSGPNSCTNSVDVTASFNYLLDNSGPITVVQGSSDANTITRTLTSGATQPVTLSAGAGSGLPAGATPSFTSITCGPTCPSTLTISTLASTPVGLYPITITGTASGGLIKTTTFTLNVTASNAPPSVNVGTPHGTTVGAPHDHSSGGASATDPDGNLSGFTWSFIPPCPGGCPGLTGASGGLSGGLVPAPITGPTYIPNAAGVHNLNLRVTDIPGAFTDQILTETAAAVPTIDLNASPLSVPWNTASTLGWTSTDATSCTASGAWSGPKSTSGSESTGNITAFPSTYTMTCTGPGGTSVPDSVIINQSTPTLSISLTSVPSPASGDIPLTVNLTAAITAYNGNPADTVNYTFWWDCGDSSNDVAFLRQASVCGEPTNPAVGAKLDGRDGGQPLPSESVSHTYISSGSYTAKVIVERSSAIPQTASLPVSVTIPPLAGLTCDVNPKSAKTGDNVTWSALWSGGESPYTVTWSGNSPLPRTLTTSVTSSSVTIQYAEPGEYDGSVTVQSSTYTQGPVTCVNTVKVAPKFEIR